MVRDWKSWSWLGSLFWMHFTDKDCWMIRQSGDILHHQYNDHKWLHTPTSTGHFSKTTQVQSGGWKDPMDGCSSGMKISVFSFLSSKSLPLWPLLCVRLCRSLPSWRWTCWSPASPTSCCGTPTTLSTNRASALTHRPPGAEDTAKADHAVRHQNASTHSNTH